MKHLKKGKKLSRIKKQRKALLKILAGELLVRGKITTTEAKAKELKIIAEKLCGMIKNSFPAGRKKILPSLRQVRSLLPKKTSAKLLFEISKTLPSEKSGFVRIIKIGNRCSDGAKMALIEIIKKEEVKK